MKKMKNKIRIKPSSLLISVRLFLKIRFLFAKIPKRTVANTQNGICFQTVSSVTTKGKIIDEIPRINKIFIILLPMILPIAI